MNWTFYWSRIKDIVKLSDDDIAKICDVSRTAVCKWRKGTKMSERAKQLWVDYLNKNYPAEITPFLTAYGDIKTSNVHPLFDREEFEESVKFVLSDRDPLLFDNIDAEDIASWFPDINEQKLLFASDLMPLMDAIREIIGTNDYLEALQFYKTYKYRMENLARSGITEDMIKKYALWFNNYITSFYQIPPEMRGELRKNKFKSYFEDWLEEPEYALHLLNLIFAKHAQELSAEKEVNTRELKKYGPPEDHTLIQYAFNCFLERRVGGTMFKYKNGVPYLPYDMLLNFFNFEIKDKEVFEGKRQSILKYTISITVTDDFHDTAALLLNMEWLCHDKERINQDKRERKKILRENAKKKHKIDEHEY